MKENKSSLLNLELIEDWNIENEKETDICESMTKMKVNEPILE